MKKKLFFWSCVVFVVSGCGENLDHNGSSLTGFSRKKVPPRQIIQWKSPQNIGNLFKGLKLELDSFRILSPYRLDSQVTVIEWEDEAQMEKATHEFKSWEVIDSVSIDFTVDLDKRGFVLPSPEEEPYFKDSWHMKKMEISNIWRQTLGDPRIVVAVVDLGFEQGHREFALSSLDQARDDQAWYVNTGEIPDNRIDDDQNGRVDDISGWNFAIESSRLIYGSAPNHGTATASILGGRINQGGSVGVCPRCKILPVVIDDRISSIILAYQYLAQFPVAVVNNSWGFRLVLPEMAPLITVINELRESGREGLGTGIVFAMSNENRDDCTGSTPDISSLPEVIAVSGVNQQDKKIVKSGFGDCLDLVAPTSQTQEGGIIAADRSGAKGVNQGGGNDLSDWDYTRKFYGTSAAAPQVSGALALIMTLHPEYSINEAQKILFDQAKKVDPVEGGYHPETGRSPRYGYGMIHFGMDPF